jgi:hypothetical protein
VASLSYVAQRTSIPSPKLIAYELDDNNAVGLPLLITSKLPGTRALDSWGTVGDNQAAHFLDQLARFHLELSRHRFPKIGSLFFRDESTGGDFYIGPDVQIHIGYSQRAKDAGPFDSDTAWTRRHLNLAFDHCYALEPSSIDEARFAHIWTQRIMTTLLVQDEFDTGSFPLQHVDLHLGHVLIDVDWNVRIN